MIGMFPSVFIAHSVLNTSGGSVFIAHSVLNTSGGSMANKMPTQAQGLNNTNLEVNP